METQSARGKSKPMRFGIREEYKVRPFAAFAATLMAPIFFLIHVMYYYRTKNESDEWQKRLESAVPQTPEKM